MKVEKCKNYENCGSPLCPLDQENLESKIWYADEEICMRNGPKPLWTKNQKKIARKTTDPDIGYFTLDMLNRRIKITKAIMGIDPDRPDEERMLVNRWFKLHPDRPKKVLTEKQLEALQKGLQNYKRQKGCLDSAEKCPHSDDLAKKSAT